MREKESRRKLNATEFCPNHKGQPVADIVHAANPEHWCYLCTTGMGLNPSKPQFMPTDFDISDADLKLGPTDE
jgi:hypothetical protein